MPHIQIATGTWVNTDHIVSVQDYGSTPPRVELYLSTNLTMNLTGNKASKFLDQYDYFCVATPRPEVG